MTDMPQKPSKDTKDKNKTNGLDQTAGWNETIFKSTNWQTNLRKLQWIFPSTEGFLSNLYFLYEHTTDNNIYFKI